MIRALGVEDVERFMALRREGLEQAPAAFMSSPRTIGRGRGASELILSPGPRQAVFGAFAPGLEAAQRLYARHGFVRWGTEPEGLFDGERFVAEHHMALALE